VLTAVDTSGATDETPVRDAYSYVVFQRNAAGVVSTVSNVTAPLPNYRLGDFVDASFSITGDNLVDGSDLQALASVYGLTGAAIAEAGASTFDIGPTVDGTTTSRPATDGQIGLDDLMGVAVSWTGGVVPPLSPRATSGPERLALGLLPLVPGHTLAATVHLQASGHLQGARVRLAWNASVVEPVAVSTANWLNTQGGIALSPEPGVLDVAVMGARETGLFGVGTLGTFTFRIIGPGDANIRIVAAEGRDVACQPFPVEFQGTTGVDEDAPARTLLFAPSPNPVRGPATLSFALSQPGRVDLSVYSVDGRLVRTLAEGEYRAGTYRITWAGDDREKRRVAPGVYFAQLSANGKRYTTRVVVLQ
jgi:hypothetical protein